MAHDTTTQNDAAETAPAAAKPTLYMFADSASDIGTLKKVTAGKIPSSAHWEGRFTNGPLWVEYFALLTGFNLYSMGTGGATADSRNSVVLDFLDYPVIVPGTQAQIAYFKANNPSYSSSATRDRDVAILQAITNDFIVQAPNIASNVLSVEDFVNQIIDTIIEQLEQLRQIGFKNIVVSQMAPMQTTPLIKILDMVSIASSTVSLLSQKLPERVNAWASDANDVTSVSIAEVGQPFEIAIKSEAVHKVLGITNAKDSCLSVDADSLIKADNKLVALLKTSYKAQESQLCGDPSTYVFFDLVHPSERIQRMLGYFSFEMIVAQQQGLQMEINEESIVNLIEKYNLGTPVTKPAKI
ncbi:hypothetical protein EV175_001778 [Coemansia sp. RSA 1933]|nr:hypothetical protein EV175_001778 [Coemansia sp. RSA 1933]